MSNEGKSSQGWSFLGVVMLALLLPGMLKLVNSVTRNIVGAEGRLAAINVDADRTLGPLDKNWLALAQGGENLKGFVDVSSEMLKSVKPEYIRIDHVYDEFGVVNKIDGVVSYKWEDLDLLVNKILAIGAKPYFSLSYMPKAIAKDGDIVGEPENWNEWATLVRKTVERYSGEMSIEGIYYEIWNEPDLFGKWKMGGKKDYRNLYANAVYGAAQAKNTRPYKIGGVATTGLYQNWVDAFFPFVLKNNLRLDFYSWHRYDSNPDKYYEDIVNLEKWVGKHPYFDKTEKIISELGPNSEKGGENDTSVGAAHLVTVARVLLPKVKYGFNFAVWGDWGIIGKPRQKALELLVSLGDERLPITGEGTWVKAIAAKKGQIHQVIMANYDQRGTHSENVPVTFLNLKNGRYVLITEMLGETSISAKVEVSQSMIQTQIPMPPNSVVKVELQPITEDG